VSAAVITTWPDALLLAGIVLLGSSVQRMSGVGFAMVAGPGLIALEGPVSGVLLSNCASCLISAVGIVSAWRGLRLRLMVPLVLAALCTVPLGTWAATRLSRTVLLIGIGVIVCAAAAVIASKVRLTALRGRPGAVIAGAASGFMNASAGVGGPPVALYALNEGWSAAELVPNALFYGVVVNAMSVLLKGFPHLTGRALLLSGSALAVGLVIGTYLSTRVPDEWAKRFVLLMATAGGLVTLIKGLAAL